MVLRAWASDERAPTETVDAALSRLRADPASPTDEQWAALLGADGPQLDDLCAAADHARRSVTDPHALTFVVNRNLDTGVVSGGLPDGIDLDDLLDEADTLGATEICMQGALPADAPADGYLQLVRRVHERVPNLHLHAFRPPEVRDGAHRMGLSLPDFLAAAREAGLGSVPGTAAQILDDGVRAALASPDGPAPDVDDWIEPILAAHDVGLFSTATMVYGHVETPAQQIAHLRLLTRIQERSKGFSELILMPMVASNTPAHLSADATGTASLRQTRALHAVARLMTLGRFDHLQVAWTKHPAGTTDLLLRGGVDDLGGLLLDGRLYPAAGAEAGHTIDTGTLAAIADRAGRVPVQRTTRYETPPADRLIPIPQVQR